MRLLTPCVDKQFPAPYPLTSVLFMTTASILKPTVVTGLIPTWRNGELDATAERCCALRAASRTPQPTSVMLTLHALRGHFTDDSGEESDRPGHCPARCSTPACTLSVQYRTWRHATSSTCCCCNSKAPVKRFVGLQSETASECKLCLTSLNISTTHASSSSSCTSRPEPPPHLVNPACTGRRLEQCPILQTLHVSRVADARISSESQAQTERSSTTRFSSVDRRPE